MSFVKKQNMVSLAMNGKWLENSEGWNDDKKEMRVLAKNFLEMNQEALIT